MARGRSNKPRIPQPHQLQQQKPQQQHVQVQQQITSWTGPLPNPEALAKFNDIITNGADRIMTMAEAEQKHRLTYESNGLAASIKEAKNGQLFGAVLAAGCIIGAVVVSLTGGSWKVAIALLGLPLISAINAIINRRSAPAKNKVPDKPA